MPLLSRSFKRKYLRPRAFLLTLTVLFLFDAYLLTSFRPLPIREPTLPPNLQNQKIYIASIHRNSEYMLRLYWNSALLRLCQNLGPKNVYVSILESGSLEDTKGALRDLEEKLNEIGVENRIELGMTVDEQTALTEGVPGEGKREGWGFTGRGEKGWEMRRIPYLAELRNRAMEPLVEMEGSRRFDTVLWVNDVVFTIEDVTTLLATRDGDFAAVCALDFSGNAEMYYDTFALRDSSGHQTATNTWPYFYSSPSLLALQALRPIPVQSCWNGLIALDAVPFYSTPKTPSPNPRSPSQTTPTPRSSKSQQQRLKFRSLPDSLANSHLEASECCLIHVDNPLRSQKGIYVNPNVRVSYNASTYSKVNGGVEVRADMMGIVHGMEGGDGSIWPGQWEMIRGMWRNRAVRWGLDVMGWARGWREDSLVKARLRRWVDEGQGVGERRVEGEVGTECLVDEMQVLFESGWMHV